MQRLKLNIGYKVNKLTIVGDYDASKHGWRCQCDCGNIYYAGSTHLVRGNVVSCGCYKKRGSWRSYPENHMIKKALFRTYKQKADKKNLIFELDFEQFSNLIIKNCFYCDGPPNSKIKTSYVNTFLYNGIDRFNNNFGYNIENCRTCCPKCNYSKGGLSFDEWKLHIKNTYKRLFAN